MKIKGPLMSQEAHGTIAGNITFSKRRSGQQARYQKKQSEPASVSQTAQQLLFLNASISCRNKEFGVAFFGISIFGVDDDFYNEESQGKKMSGYNLCIKETIGVI